MSKKNTLVKWFFSSYFWYFTKKNPCSFVILFSFSKLINSQITEHWLSFFFKKYYFWCWFAGTLMIYSFFFGKVWDIFVQKSHDSSVIFSHFLKNIANQLTLLSWFFFQEICTKTTSISWCSNGFCGNVFVIFVKNNHDNGVILEFFV